MILKRNLEENKMGYSGVELQSLDNDNVPDEVKNLQILNKKLDYYISYCQKCAPFPFNYLGKTGDTKTLAIIIGLLLHEGVLK
jgi:hypothetical protein